MPPAEPILVGAILKGRVIREGVGSPGHPRCSSSVHRDARRSRRPGDRLTTPLSAIGHGLALILSPAVWTPGGPHPPIRPGHGGHFRTTVTASTMGRQPCSSSTSTGRWVSWSVRSCRRPTPPRSLDLRSRESACARLSVRCSSSSRPPTPHGRVPDRRVHDADPQRLRPPPGSCGAPRPATGGGSRSESPGTHRRVMVNKIVEYEASTRFSPGSGPADLLLTAVLEEGFLAVPGRHHHGPPPAAARDVASTTGSAG